MSDDKSVSVEDIRSIFADILGVPRIGLDDDFFDLQGNSLKAMRLVNRVRSELHRDVGVRTLFEAPTVTTFAARVSAAGRSDKPVLRPRTGQ